MVFSWIVLIVGVVLICVGASRMSAAKAATLAAQRMLSQSYHEGFVAGARSVGAPPAQPNRAPDAAAQGARVQRPLPAPSSPGHPGPLPPHRAGQSAPLGLSAPGLAQPTALPGGVTPVAAVKPLRNPEDRRAIFINAVLGAATFLLVVAAGLWVGTRLDPLGQGAALVALSAAFYASGLVLHGRQPALRPVALAFSITGLALLPIVGAAWWLRFPQQGPGAWVVVSAVGTVAYLFAAVRLDSRIVAALGVVFAASGAFTFGAAMRSGIVWYAASSTLLALVLSLVATRFSTRLPRVLGETFVLAHRVLVPSYLVVALCAMPWLRTRDALIITGSALIYYVIQRLLAPQRDRMLTRWGARSAWLGVVFSLCAVLGQSGAVTLRLAAAALLVAGAESVWALRRDEHQSASAPRATSAVPWAQRGEHRRTPAVLFALAALCALLGTMLSRARLGNTATSFLDTSLNWSWYLILVLLVLAIVVPTMSRALGEGGRLVLLAGASAGAFLEPTVVRPWPGGFLLLAVALVCTMQWSRTPPTRWRTAFGGVGLATGLAASGPLLTDVVVALGARVAVRGDFMCLVWAVVGLGLGAWRAVVAAPPRRGDPVAYRWGAGALLAVSVGAGSLLGMRWPSFAPRRGPAVLDPAANGASAAAIGVLGVLGVVVACLALAVAAWSAARVVRALGAARTPGQPPVSGMQGWQALSGAQTAPAVSMVVTAAASAAALAGPALVLGMLLGGANDRVVVVVVAALSAATLLAVGSTVWGRSGAALLATAVLLVGQWQVVVMTGAPGVVVLPSTAAILLVGTVVATARPASSRMLVLSASTAGVLLLGPWAEAFRTRVSIGSDAVQPAAFLLLLLLAVAAVLWHARVAQRLDGYRAGTPVALLAVGLTALRAVDGQWAWWWGDQVLSAYPATVAVFAWAVPALLLVVGASAPAWSRHSAGPAQAVAWAAGALGLTALLLGHTALAELKGGAWLLAGGLLGGMALACLSLSVYQASLHQTSLHQTSWPQASAQQTPAHPTSMRRAGGPGGAALAAIARAVSVPALASLICGVGISLSEPAYSPAWLGWVAAIAVALSAVPVPGGTWPGAGRAAPQQGTDLIGVLAPGLSLVILGQLVVDGPGGTVLALAAAIASLFLAATRPAWWMGVLAFVCTAWAAIAVGLDLSAEARGARPWLLIHAVMLALVPALICRRVAARGALTPPERYAHRVAGWVALGLLGLGAIAALGAGRQPGWLVWALLGDVVVATGLAWLMLRRAQRQGADTCLDAGMSLAGLALVRAIAVEGGLRVAPFWFLAVLALMLLGTAWWRRAQVNPRRIRLWAAAGTLLLSLLTVVQGTHGTAEEWGRHAVLVALFALLLVMGAAVDDAAATWIGLAGLCVDVLVAARHQRIAMLFLLAVMLFGIATWLLLRKNRAGQATGPVRGVPFPTPPQGGVGPGHLPAAGAMGPPAPSGARVAQARPVPGEAWNPQGPQSNLPG